MTIGETIKGYLISTPANRFNEDVNDIVIQDKTTGEQTRYATAGQLKRDVADNMLVVGRYTEITRNEDSQEKSKAGKSYTLTNFTTLQDADDTLSDAQFAVLGNDVPVTKKPTAVNVKELAANKIKASAEALSAQVSKKA